MLSETFTSQSGRPWPEPRPPHRGGYRKYQVCAAPSGGGPVKEGTQFRCIRYCCGPDLVRPENLDILDPEGFPHATVPDFDIQGAAVLVDCRHQWLEQLEDPGSDPDFLSRDLVPTARWSVSV
jgi:hypothetical protein